MKLWPSRIDRSSVGVSGSSSASEEALSQVSIEILVYYKFLTSVQAVFLGLLVGVQFAVGLAGNTTRLATILLAGYSLSI